MREIQYTVLKKADTVIKNDIRFAFTLSQVTRLLATNLDSASEQDCR